MTAVHFDVRLPYPVDLVWRAIADKRLLAEWFVPTNLEPTPGGVFHAYPPSGMPGFPVFLKVEVLAVQAFARLEMRWSGTSTHTTVTWTLQSVQNETVVTIDQSGYLGLSGEERGRELQTAYQLIFAERLPQILARIAEPPAPLPLVIPPAQPSRQGWRLQLVSLGAAMIITVLVATALAVFLLRDPYLPADASPPQRSPQVAVQAGHTPSPTPSTSPLAARAKVPVPKPAAVSYKTTESFNGGYIGSITITPGRYAVSNWKAVIELPRGATVTSAWDRITFKAVATKVTFTPQPSHQLLDAESPFTFHFQVSDPSGAHRPISYTLT